ncbi:MAG: MaoC family dehydratase N-terminal domain-containing protein [Pseudomonadota bacterium]
MAAPDLQTWMGRTDWFEDVLRAAPAQFMQATLDAQPTLRIGDTLPPLWHWLYFLDAKPLSELGRDAHPRRGGFLPPVALPRRMWAGGRFEFHTPLSLGKAVEKRSVIKAISEKNGRSGPLCFVTVGHEVWQDGTCALSEEQDLVFRDDPDPNAPQPAPEMAPDGAEFSQTLTPSEVMLFRYSALTFNGHRIHYDVDYARQVEGYRGLVFHGPLIATLLSGLAEARLGRALTRFDYRALTPLDSLEPFELQGRTDGEGLSLWARRADGAMAMRATAE